MKDRNELVGAIICVMFMIFAIIEKDWSELIAWFSCLIWVGIAWGRKPAEDF